MIKEAYTVVIKILAMYGDEYWPLYQRMHREVKECEEKEAVKALAGTTGENS